MKIFVYSGGMFFERWDFRNPDNPGIGGSETAAIEMAQRLAKRGHDVTSFAPIPDDCPAEHQGVKWRDFTTADKSEDGIWFVFRQPKFADDFEPSETRKAIMIAEDVSYFEGCGGAYTPERAAKFESIVGLCKVHCDFLRTQYPFMADRVVESSNGICSDRIPMTAGRRDPHKLVWSSSPDRGLEALLLILQRALEFEPQLKLHVFYGFDNWDKVISSHYLKSPGVGYRDARWPESVPSQTVFDVMNLHAPYCIENGVAKRQTRYGEPVESKPRCPQESMKWRILELAAACGDAVVWGGRIGQSRLWRELLTAGLWVYPTTFQETSCISCMEAQACGAIPITAPIWATGQNVKFGSFIEGDPIGEPLVRARYIAEMVEWIRNPDEDMRASMMRWAREKFNWERIVDQWESWCVESPVEAELCSA